VKLAISNLAWEREDQAAVAELIRATGGSGVELAPTKIWEEPLSATDAEVSECRQFWESFRIEIVALQSLLFDRPDLELFAGVDTRAEMLRYLSEMNQLGARLGARVLVFGSPRNRQRHGLSDDEAAGIAVPFFRSLAADAAACGVTFCIEPNPEKYGCDWITTSAEGLRLVEAVGSEGFGLHLDAGGMTLSAEDPMTSIAACAHVLKHFHISEPGLAAVGSAVSDGARHDEFARALDSAGYSGWKSIEMVPPVGNALEGIETALRQSDRWYG